MQSLEIRGVCVTANVIIAAGYLPSTSYAYFFRSTDNGATWAMVDSFGIHNSSPNLPLFVVPSFTFTVNGKSIIAGIGGEMSRGDIFRSNDAGLSWSDNGISWPESGYNGAENINSLCVLDESIFAGTFHGVFVSTDHGAMWKAVNTGLTLPVEAITSVGSSLFASTQGNGIFISTNGGLAWSTIDTTDYIFMSLATIGTHLFAGAFQFYGQPSTGGVFLSTDSGGTWTHSDSGLTNHEVNVLISSGSDLYAGTNSGAFSSTNEGASWKFDSAGSASDSMGVLALSVTSSSLIEGTLHGVWVHALP